MNERQGKFQNFEELSLTGVVSMQKPVCVKMPRDYHVIIVIVVMQCPSLLHGIRVDDLVIKSVLNACSLCKSLHSSQP